MVLTPALILVLLLVSLLVCVALSLAWQPPLLPGVHDTPNKSPRQIVDETLREPGLALLVTSIAMSVALALMWRHDWQARGLFLALLAHVLITLAAIDWRTGWLPDSITQPGLWLGILGQLIAPVSTVGLHDAVLGAAVGYGLPLMLSSLFAIWKGDGAIGGGDLKLSALVGGWLGPHAVLFVWVAAPLGLVVAVLPVLGSGALSRRIVFGPWLAGAGLACLFFQPTGI